MQYSIAPEVEAFATEKSTVLDFPVVLPLHQAHGTRVVRVPADDEAITGVDALITNQPGLRIGVKTADCVPILVYDAGTQSIAAIHSGWRGTVANIIAQAIDAMRREFGTNPADCMAVIGPCIHVESFEVGDELYNIFANAGYAEFCIRMNMGGATAEKWHIDLPEICRKQLVDCGVHDIEVRPECTYTLHHRFYSARRLGPNFAKQRILNCIMLK